MLNDTIHTYTFDAENKISKVDNVSAYVYDGAGQRVRKFVGENTRFVYGIGGELIMEFDGGSGNLKKEYVYGGGIMMTIAPNGKGSLGAQYATSDMLGSPRVVTNSSSSVVSRHDYMPFGEELFAGTGGRTTGMGFSVSDGNRQKFTGYERDSETGLDFAQARYNSSVQGRFTSPDSLLGTIGNPQTLNRYAYVANNPLKFTDPSGHEMYSATTHGPERGIGVVNSTDHIFSEFMIPDAGWQYENPEPAPAPEAAPYVGDGIVQSDAGETAADEGNEPPQNSAGTITGTVGEAPENSCPNCISNAVAGSIGTSRGIIEAVGPNGPTGLAVHDGDHVLSGPGGPAAVTTLGPLAGTVIRTGNQGDGLHYLDVRLNSSIAGVPYNVRYKDLLTVGVAVGSRLHAGTYIGTVRPAGDPRSEIGLHVTLVKRSEYAGYVNRVRNGQYSPIGIFMSAVSDPRSPVRCPCN